ncbi:PEP-CTERM sorting domain-containing protein [Edaphobacter aggregans]|uniref:PEP-CTERM sorting domain-containing protein n=1 Tax=Edaphobacter aggregans TaxID=570835 RepID=UPI0005552814|nr:PEP-CTERM sorting domain-containing protein [Edaphobacter aggregans]
MVRLGRNVFVLGVAALLCLPFAKGDTLLPGSVIPASQVPLPEGPPGQPFLHEVGFYNGVVSGGGFSANYATYVFSDPANVYCAGCLDFMFGLGGITSGQIDAFTVGGFGGLDTDAGYGFGFGYGGTPPTTIGRDATGDLITFYFANPVIIDPVYGSQRPAFMLVQTNATEFVRATAEGGTLEGLTTLEPVVPPPSGVIPEPSTLALLGTGLASVAGAIRRRLAR